MQISIASVFVFGIAFFGLDNIADYAWKLQREVWMNIWIYRCVLVSFDVCASCARLWAIRFYMYILKCVDVVFVSLSVCFYMCLKGSMCHCERVVCVFFEDFPFWFCFLIKEINLYLFYTEDKARVRERFNAAKNTPTQVKIFSFWFSNGFIDLTLINSVHIQIFFNVVAIFSLLLLLSLFSLFFRIMYTTTTDIRSACRIIPGLSRGQLDLCYKANDVTIAALDGLDLAVHECQLQVKSNAYCSN